MNAIAEKIHIIESLSPDPKATVRLLDKVIGCLADDHRRKLAELTAQQREFEERYGLTTAEFQKRFNSGELGDAMDYFEWDAIADMVSRLEGKLEALGESHHAG